jgi:hypothetical protein
MDADAERTRLCAYVVVALAAFLAGVALGQLGVSRKSAPSRIEWPQAPHPRSLGL